MERVAARLGYQVDDTAAGATVFRGKVVGQNTECRHGIKGDLLPYRRATCVYVFRDIEQHASRGRPQAVDGISAASGCGSATAAVAVFCHIACRRYERIRIPGGISR